MKIIGAKAHAARLKRIRSAGAMRRVGAALFAAGEMIQVEAQIMISTGSVSGRAHVPSAPGQPPNYDTGVLSNSIETNQIAPLTVEVSSNAPYAAALEFGSSKMAERPYMRPAAAKKRKEAVQLVRRAVDAAIRGR